MKIHVDLRERVLVNVNGRPERYLGPGRHWLFRPFKKVRLEGVHAQTLLADLDAEQLALVPPEDLNVVSIASHERGLVTRKGQPVLWLRPGEHQLWTIERTPVRGGAAVPTVRIEVLDTSAATVRPLPDELRPLVPSADYAEVTAPEGSVAIRYVDGVLESVLPAGRHAAWTTVRKVQFAVIDLRERLLPVNGQEVMTKDRVSLRLNLSASFRVADAKRLATVARAPDELVYLAMQLAARDAVAIRTLDELLAARDELSTQLHREVATRLEPVGLKLESFGVKDLILPGEMKTLLNKVIEAQKEAEANVILRREETAATRSLAQTAKVLAENPIILRLKELEAYKDLAGKVGQLNVVLGEGALPTLQLKT